jgi:hypothetical protein
MPEGEGTLFPRFVELWAFLPLGFLCGYAPAGAIGEIEIRKPIGDRDCL